MRHCLSNLWMNIYGKKQIVYQAKKIGIRSLLVPIWFEIDQIMSIAVTYNGLFCDTHHEQHSLRPTAFHLLFILAHCKMDKIYTNSYHFIPFHTISYHFIPFHTISYHFIPFHLVHEWNLLLCTNIAVTYSHSKLPYHRSKAN